MKSYIYAAAAVLTTGFSAQALAQSYYPYTPERPIQWHLDGGYAATTGRTSDYLNGGFTFGGGLTWRPVAGSPFALRADLSYSQFGATNQLITLGEQQNQTQIDDGTGRVINFDVDGVFSVPLGPRAKAYAMAGVGGAWRQIDLTQTVAFSGYFCDYWWGFCGAGYFPGDVLVSRESTTRFVWNAGIGVEFPLYNGQSWFIEARYNRMETREPTEFIPIRIGLRF